MHSDIFTYIDPSPPPIIEGRALSGKSISIQPNMSVRGWPTEAGSMALEEFVALENATIVERLRNAGAVIKGSTHMSELGFGLAGETGNKALTEGLVDITLIIDTMGEARIGAATSGVFGFKPSYGIISRFGLIGLVPSMECYGILANTPKEIALVTGVIAGKDDRDFSMPEYETLNFSQVGQNPGSIESIGVIRECVKTLKPPESEAFYIALEKVGLKIQELNLTDYDLFRLVHNVIGSVEASSSAGKYDGVRYGHRTVSAKDWNEMYLKSRAESFGLLVKTYLFQGAYFQFENYTTFENAARIRSLLLHETEKLFNEVDVLAFPTRRFNNNAFTATTIEDVYDAFSLTLFANINGQPAVHIPGFVICEGIDMGLQLVGPCLSDVRLLSIAAQLPNLVEGDR